MISNVLKGLVFSVSVLALTAGCGKPQEQAVKSYTTTQECTADIAEDATSEEKEKVTRDCQTAFEQSRVEHERTVTTYQTMDSCSQMYNNCYRRDDGVFVAAMTGFMLGYVAGSPVYHPYVYDRWSMVHSGPTTLGYYRGGYIYAPAGSPWVSRGGYANVTVNKGAPPPPASSVRGVFGTTARAAAGGVSRPMVSNPSPSGRGGSVATSSPSGRAGGFGGSAASAASGSGG